jgi:hypothetical protein
MIALRLGRLDVKIDGAHVTLSGRIDDSAALGELLPLFRAAEITIDTGAVTFINSIGMREWMRLIRALRERGRVVLERVADVLMTQMNMIPEFVGISITSFHAQYACAACGAESARLVDAVACADTLRKLVAPPMPCPECGKPMELADFPERYLLLFKA